MRTMLKAHKPVSHLRLAVPILLIASLIAAIAGQACGGDEGGALSTGSLGLVPDDFYGVTVVNVEQILRGDVPRQLEDQLEDQWEDELEQIGVSIDDLTTLVIAYGEDGRLIVLEGEIDFEDVRDELDDADYDDDRYQGFEVWEEGRQFVEMDVVLVEMAALLEERGEERGQMVIGNAEAVEDALKTLNRGSGSLLDDAASDLGRVLGVAGEGWVVFGREGCDVYEVRGCLASGTAFHRGDADYLVELTAAFLFRNERTAESEMEDLEDEIDDGLSRDFDIEEVRLEGEFVIMTISVDEDDWDTPFLR